MKNIEEINKANVQKIIQKKKIPEFFPGDTIRVGVRIVEGKRERIQNTWVGDDTAMPHAVINRCEKTILAVLRLAEPIDYQNGKMVRHIFATLGPARERNVHLAIISRISSLIMEGDLFNHFNEAPNLMEALKSCDEKFAKKAKAKKKEKENNKKTSKGE